MEPLSEIIRLLNERFGTNFTDKDKVSLKGLEERLAGHPALSASLKANTKENARLTFDHVVKDQLQEMVDTNFELYKRVTDDGQFATRSAPGCPVPASHPPATWPSRYCD